MKFKLIGMAAVMCALLFGTVAPASAHILRNDKGIAVEMHLPPDDLPLATVPQRVELTFEEAPDTFNRDDCDCKLSVVSGARTIATVSPQPIPDTADKVAATVTLPEAGDYQLRLSGNTAGAGSDRFQVTYSAHAGPAPHKPTSTARIVTNVVVGLCGLAAIVMLVNELVPRRKHK